MRRRVSTLIIFLVSALAVRAAHGNVINQQVSFGTNKFYSLYMFARGLTGAPDASPVLKIAFDQSEYANNRDLIEAIDKLKSVSSYQNYTFDTYPRHRKYEVQLWQLLKMVAAKSENIDEFKSGASGMLPLNDLNDLAASLLTLQAVHNELVWRPNKEGMQVYVESLSKDAAEGNFNEMFERAIKFYGTEWTNSLPMKVYVLPLPVVENNMIEIASPEGNTLTYSIHIKKGRDLKEDLGVVFHELNHILYKNQPADLQNKLERQFLNHISPYKVIGYQVLDEAVATALAQGYFYKYLSGNIDEGDWYDVPQINKVAKSIYPMVNDYMKNQRTIDSAFVDRYLKTYEEAFPDDLKDIQSNISNINILMSEAYSDPTRVFAPFFSHFNMRSIKNFNGVNPASIIKWEQSLGTKLVVINTGLEEYNQLKTTLNWLPNIDTSLDQVISKLHDGTHYYIVMISDYSSLDHCIQLIRDREKISDKVEISIVDG